MSRIYSWSFIWAIGQNRFLNTSLLPSGESFPSFLTRLFSLQGWTVWLFNKEQKQVQMYFPTQLSSDISFFLLARFILGCVRKCCPLLSIKTTMMHTHLRKCCILPIKLQRHPKQRASLTKSCSDLIKWQRPLSKQRLPDKTVQLTHKTDNQSASPLYSLFVDVQQKN
jgi:hypothetical protein